MEISTVLFKNIAKWSMYGIAECSYQHLNTETENMLREIINTCQNQSFGLSDLKNELIVILKSNQFKYKFFLEKEEDGLFQLASQIEYIATSFPNLLQVIQNNIYKSSFYRIYYDVVYLAQKYGLTLSEKMYSYKTNDTKIMIYLLNNRNYFLELMINSSPLQI